jgi:sugar phosphate isomerase/epimerase
MSWIIFGPQSSQFGLAATRVSGMSSAMKTPKLSVQLYSLRRETQADAAGTVRKVPGLGYDGIELAGDYGWSADQWRKTLDETGLAVVGAHLGLEVIEKDIANAVKFQKALGNSRVIVPALPKELHTPDGYRQAAGRLNAVAAKLKGEGFSTLYHNHAFEFTKLGDGSCGMTILLEAVDPALVKFEVDTYWVERGGEDARKFVADHAAQVGIIHAKELRKRDNADVPAGQGDVDFKNIIPMATKNQWPIVVEYEGENALESVRESAKYLRTLL